MVLGAISDRQRQALVRMASRADSTGCSCGLIAIGWD